MFLELLIQFHITQYIVNMCIIINYYIIKNHYFELNNKKNRKEKYKNA